MDEQIRARLLAMPGEYNHQAAQIVTDTVKLGRLRREVEAIKTRITAEVVATFPEKSNDTARRALIAEALASSAELQRLELEESEAEIAIKCYQLWIQALDFEHRCLAVVANNDDRVQDVKVQ